MGWDRLVEFPYSAARSVSLDKRPHPIECKIQVKTVWADTTRISLTLSAAELLAKSRLPSFIIALAVNEALEFTAMYGFHLIDDHLARILYRLRKAEAEGSLDINKAVITFDLDSGTRLDVTGTALRDYVIQSCGSDLDAYGRTKSDQQNNLGFSYPRYQGAFTVKARSARDLDELFLGLKSAELVRLEAHEIRFGVSLPADVTTGGMISINPRPAAKCKLVVATRASARSASMDGKVYLPLHRAGEPQMCRISVPLIDVIVETCGGGAITVTNDVSTFHSDLVALDDIAAALRFYQILYEGGGRLTLFVGNKPCFGGELGGEINLAAANAARAKLELVEAMRTIFEAARVVDRRVVLDELVKQSSEIGFLHHLTAASDTIRIDPLKFTKPGDIELPELSEDLVINTLVLSNMTLAYYAVADLRLLRSESEITVQIDRISLRDLSEIGPEADAFDGYCDLARAITGLGLAFVVNPPRDIGSRVAD